MTRLLHWSDLHTEFRNFELPDIPDDIDALLLGGDTGVGRGHLGFLEEAWDKYRIPIVSIWGNHELYQTSFKNLRSYEKTKLAQLREGGADIRVLHAETTKIKDTTIFGATMWTDFELYPAQEVTSKRTARHRMRDFHAIWSDTAYGPITPDDVQKIHWDERQKLRKALSSERNGPMIVMTHHVPHEAAVSRRYRGDPLTPAFCSNMIDEIEMGPDFWIFGHTHDGVEVDIPTDRGLTRLRHNPRGYPDEGSPFDPFRIIDTESPEKGSI